MQMSRVGVLRGSVRRRALDESGRMLTVLPRTCQSGCHHVRNSAALLLATLVDRGEGAHQPRKVDAVEAGHTDVGWCGESVCADASDRSDGHEVGLRRDSCDGMTVGEQPFAGLVAALDVRRTSSSWSAPCAGMNRMPAEFCPRC